MDAKVFSSIPLFRDIPPEALESIVRALPSESFRAGEFLFKEGEAGEHLYVVQEGELEVLLAPDSSDEMLLKVIGPGEYVGEMGLILKDGRRTAAVRSRTPSKTWLMSRAAFNDLLLRWPVMAFTMVNILSQRLDATNNASFRDLTEKNHALQKAYDDLRAAQAQLIEKERLERELKVAADIQVSILPDVLPHVGGFDFGARILPARRVGGDFYDVFPLDSIHTGVLIGDVADKGIPAAIFMARAHALIMAAADSNLGPGEVLQIANEHITRLQKNAQFVTVLYGVVNSETREFAYARAGHEPPLMLKPDGSTERIPHAAGMALGLWEHITIDMQLVRLPPGSTLLLFTDGMTDCRDPNGVQFGISRISERLSGLLGFAAQGACDQLLQTLSDYQAGSNQDDDVTLVAIHSIE